MEYRDYRIKLKLLKFVVFYIRGSIIIDTDLLDLKFAMIQNFE